MRLRCLFVGVSTLFILSRGAAEPAASAPKRVVFLAGGPSHDYGSHEYYAGSMLLARLLRENAPGLETTVVRGWPTDASMLAEASALVIGCDNGSLITQHLAELDALMEQGKGLAVLHYALAVPKGKPGDAMLEWIGGYYETFWSVNPTWQADFKGFPEHPVTRGVRPFSIGDEWYYHRRFREGREGVTPVLTAVPPDSTRDRPDGEHSNNPTVRAGRGMAEHVAWVYQRADGGRGFGFTGIHPHWNWAHDDYRKLVLNAIAWSAGVDVPRDGVPSKTPTLEELQQNLDEPIPDNWNPEPVERMIRQFNLRVAGDN